MTTASTGHENCVSMVSSTWGPNRANLPEKKARGFVHWQVQPIELYLWYYQFLQEGEKQRDTDILRF
jgi:hypothetical protein